MIEFVEIPLGTGRVCECQRCGEPVSHVFFSAEVVGARVSGVAASWGSGPGPNVLLCGPEPFSHPELPRIVADAVSAGVERIGLRTDAGALSVPGNAEGVIGAGVSFVQVVLLGGDEVSHDGLAGRQGLFDAARRGVGALTAAAAAAGERVALTGLIPTCAHNLAALPATVAAMAEMGAVAVEIAVSGSARGARGSGEWIASAVDTGMVNGVWVSVTGLERPDVPRSALHAIAPFSLAGGGV